MTSTIIPAADVAEMLTTVAEQRRPFSFIRMGDGEGALMRFDAATAPQSDVDYFQMHFGAATSRELLADVASLLRKALASADLIGNRDDVAAADPAVLDLSGDEPDFDAWARAALPLRPIERDLEGHPLRRLVGLAQWAARELPTGVPVCSSWVGYDLAQMGFWEPFLARQHAIGLIHCSPDLAARLRGYGLDVEHHLIPDAAAARGRWPHDDGSEAIYPDAFERVTDALARPLGGKVFLVGGGLIGKAYCMTVKRMGGVAIDMGAVLDCWDGRGTRPAVYATKASGRDDHAAFSLRAERFA